jgi:cytochrome P450
MEGNLWKTWRGIFNPGFSAGYLMSLTKSIVVETETFCGILERLSREHTVFRMKDLTDNLTMDIIGRIVMYGLRLGESYRYADSLKRNAELDSQRHSNPLVDGLRMQVKWLTFGADVNPITRYNPLRPIVHWYNSWRMNDYVARIIDSRFTELQSEEGNLVKGNKSIIDLVLTAYLSENAARKSQTMDSTFKRFTMSQIKLFLFSGHDTTSSTVCYIFYILATNPAVLARVRAEHVSVIGPDPSKFASVIASDPFLLNELPYTIAVIKEVLRMFPAVSGTRAGEPNFYVTDDLGRHFPTDGFLVWDNPQVIHRDPIYWQNPDDFIPDRWLVAPDDSLHPVKGAWRPFSHGPRNCIGQELAMNEMKVMMVMTAQRFDIGLAYEDMDRTKRTKAITTVNGERGYQIGRAQPSDDLPCRVAENSG